MSMYTIEDLARLEMDELQSKQRLAEARAQLKPQNLQRYKEQLRLNGFTIQELFSEEEIITAVKEIIKNNPKLGKGLVPKAPATELPAIFKDPATGKEWSGRGPKIISWLEDYKKAGKKYSEFLVPGTTWTGDKDKPPKSPPHWVRALREEKYKI